MNATEPTGEAGWTLSQWDNVENGGAWLNYHKLITTGASENFDMDWFGTESESGMFSMFGLNPAASGTTISDVNYNAANRGIQRGMNRGMQ